MPRILLLISGHLCTAPRPQKEADTLFQAGYDVTVAGVWFDPVLIERDINILRSTKWKFEPIVDFRVSNKFSNLTVRAQLRFAKEKFGRLKLFSPELLGYSIKSMLKFALKFHADLTIVHSEAGLWIGDQLLARGYRVGVDFEDWFSEDLLPENRVFRPIFNLKCLERSLAQNCRYCLTTSYALADELSKAYDTHKPSVIYNVFPWSERLNIDHQIQDRKNTELVSIHWFSQTIGPGRGLELLFQSLSLLHAPCEIHLRGNISQKTCDWLNALIPSRWQDYVFIHPTVSNHQLLSRIAEHDIGLALEIPYCSSKDLTASNKVFQYLQAGLALVATDTAGQREILSQCLEVGYLVSWNDPLELAQALENLIIDPARLSKAKASALRVAKEKFSWEHQSHKILDLISETLCIPQKKI